ncbi:SKP1-like protein 14 [Euphorbia lathyris]|uniref:SKP1-like protein 14 n=1 Tax=Euphorbia lathyris TaxID=212925 RepID=UPI0033133928
MSSSSTGNTSNAAVSVPPSKKITLKTGDNTYFHVEESIAMEMATVRTFLSDDDAEAGTAFPVPNVSAKYMSLIIQYIEEQLKFRADSERQEEKFKYDAKFVEVLGDEELKEILLAVHYLEIKSFLDMLYQAVADRIKNWSVERVRAFFGIDNDVSPEEEAENRREYAWVHEDVEN